MSEESHRTSVFTFQSSVHSSHVLQCLDEQRQKDLLCDLTVVVENRRFRAHRSVLASCSDYFGARMSSHANQGLIMTLPDEVSAEGFEPLLQFAYTSKLLFTKENVLEIRSCAAVLGFKNLDKACFDFILPKFFDSSRSSRKQCCKTKCWRSKAKLSSNGKDGVDDGVDDSVSDGVHNSVNNGVDNDVNTGVNNEVNDDVSDSVSDDVKDSVNAREAHSGPSPRPAEREEKESSCPYNLDQSTVRSYSPCAFEVEANAELDYSLLCPKYRKFQLACGRSQSNADASGSEAETADGACLLSCLQRFGTADRDGADTASGEASPQPDEEQSTATAFCCPLVKQSRPLAPPPQEAVADVMLGKEPRDPCCVVGTSCPSASADPGSEQRSSEEMEVANQLTLWHSVCSLRVSAQSMLERGPEQQCLRQPEPRPKTAECPFLRDVGVVGARLEADDGPHCSVESPYASSMQSGEDSDSFDTEGDSESYTRKRAIEMRLPFSVERIASLSRNDFQQMLKVHCLTREQLDFVHDVRRRSKNRIAARRCRKRKLDCIYNLQCEIERLRSEKEKLTTEKQQLDQLKLNTWHSYMGLYERLCAEAKLQPEQVQVFAKYTSVGNCPLSAHLSGDQRFYHGPKAEPWGTTAGCTAAAEPGPSTSGVLEPPAGRARGRLQSLSSPGHSRALSDPLPTDTQPSDPSHTEPCEMAAMQQICPDQISKLDTDKY